MSHRMFGFADPKGYFDNIHESRVQVRMCGSEPIVALLVEEDPDPTTWIDDVPYWGWEDADRPGRFHMIFHHKTLLRVCFPYGLGAAVGAGRGRPVHLRIVEEP